MHGKATSSQSKEFEMRCDICGQYMSLEDSYLVSGETEDEEHKDYKCANGHTKSDVKKVKKPKVKPS